MQPPRWALDSCLSTASTARCYSCPGIVPNSWASCCAGAPSTRFNERLRAGDWLRTDRKDLLSRYSARTMPTRRFFPWLSGRRSLSADLPVRGCYRGTRCEPGCPRRKRSAVYRSVYSAGRGEWCHHVIAECQGAYWRALLSLGSGSIADGIVGRVHRNDRRPEVGTGAPQVAAPT